MVITRRFKISLVIFIIFLGYFLNTMSPIAPTALGVSRDQRVEESLKLLNGLKNSAKGSMDLSKYRASLIKRAKDLERDLDVTLVTSTILSEGPIVLQDK